MVYNFQIAFESCKGDGFNNYMSLNPSPLFKEVFFENTFKKFKNTYILYKKYV